jgi:hypothetical protein
MKGGLQGFEIVAEQKRLGSFILNWLRMKITLLECYIMWSCDVTDVSEVLDASIIRAVRQQSPPESR